MTTAPRFSIIIPVYNVAPYLRECLDSVLAQTYADWEVVCVDDGSTDGSDVILDEYVARDSRIRAIHQENKGVSAARNRALKEATGEWMWFVDGDDLIHPDSLRVISSYVGSNPTVDLIKIKNVLSDAVPTSWGCYEFRTPQLLTKKDTQLLDAFDGASRFIIRRSIVQGTVFEPYRWLEDVLFVVCCIGNARDMLLTSDVFYFYRKRSGSAIHSKRTAEQVAEIFRAMGALIDAAMNVMGCYPGLDYGTYWKRLHSLAYFTFRKEYFSLTASDRKALLDSWLALQDRFSGRYSIPTEWRLRLLLVRLFRSGLLVKPFVLWGCQLRSEASKLISKLKGLVK